MPIHQRKIARISHPDQKNQKSRDSRLRSAWLAIPSALHSRPEPRSAWDSAARDTCPTAPWERIVDPMRSALRAAVRTGDPLKVKTVTMKIEAFFDEMKADVLSVNPEQNEVAIVRLAIEETDAQHDGDVAILEVLADPKPTPEKLHTAEVALARHENTLRRTRTALGTMLRHGIRPLLTVHK